MPQEIRDNLLGYACISYLKDTDVAVSDKQRLEFVEREFKNGKYHITTTDMGPATRDTLKTLIKCLQRLDTFCD